METTVKYVDLEYVRAISIKRDEDTNKYDYGHALLVCGCERMPGAAVLATGAALKSGCGLVSLHSTSTACMAAMVSCPSAMLSRDTAEVISTVPAGIQRYTCVAVGPGLGKDERTVRVLRDLMEACKDKPMVLDADALNILSEHRELMGLIPENSVLTPHMGELKRLLDTDKPAEEMIMEFCTRRKCNIAVKGPGTGTYTHIGVKYINTTGNAGLAKGGSGDVLTGLICGLIARGYPPERAAVLGIWLHGHAGDRLTAERTAECWNSRDLLDVMHFGFRELYDDIV